MVITGSNKCFYPVPGYEKTSGGAVTKHYSFGGRFVALRNSGGAMLVCTATSGGTCLLIGGGASTVISVGSSGITTANALNGDANATDAVVAWSTTVVGGKFGNVGKGAVGFGVSVAQRIYDWWASQQ